MADLIPAPSFSRKDIYLPDGWDTEWKAAKAASPTTPAWITVIGDSIAMGLGSSDVQDKSWIGRIKAALQPIYGTYGDYWPRYGMGGYNAGTNTPWSRMLNGVTEAIYNDWGYQRMTFQDVGVTAVAHQRFTLPYATVQTRMFYTDNGTPSFQYSINGGANVTVGPKANTKAMLAINLGPLAAGATIDVGWQSAAFGVSVDGIATIKANTGIGYGRIVSPGAAANDYATNSGPTDRALVMQGVVPQNAGGTGTSFGFPTAPHLAILALGVNDCNLALTTAALQNVYRRMIQSFRRGNANCSVLILAHMFPDGTNADVTWGANGANYHNWLIAMRDMADSYGCAFVNIHTRWGETPFAQGFVPNNDIHPLDAGHQDIATVLLSII